MSELEVDLEANEQSQVPENSLRLVLKETVTADQLESLVDQFLVNRNHDLAVDASAVTRLDTPCVEVLLSAAKLWAADKCSLTYSAVSEQFESVLAVLGIERRDIEEGVV